MGALWLVGAGKAREQQRSHPAFPARRNDDRRFRKRIEISSASPVPPGCDSTAGCSGA
jgi:hypothetical protein